MSTWWSGSWRLLRTGHPETGPLCRILRLLRRVTGLRVWEARHTHVRVFATNTSGEGESSAPKQMQTPANPEDDQVTGVTVTPGAEELMVTWDPVSGATHYHVQWKSIGSHATASVDDPGTTGNTRRVGSGTRTYTIEDLTAGTEYMVRVYAIGNATAPNIFGTVGVGTPSHADADGVTGTPKPAKVTGGDGDPRRGGPCGGPYGKLDRSPAAGDGHICRAVENEFPGLQRGSVRSHSGRSRESHP